MPGTLYPLLGKLFCFLPEHLKKKLCCVTPLGQTVRERIDLIAKNLATFIYDVFAVE